MNNVFDQCKDFEYIEISTKTLKKHYVHIYKLLYMYILFYICIYIYVHTSSGHHEVPSGKQGWRSEELMAVLLRPDCGGHQEAAVLCGGDSAKTSGHSE